MMCGSKKLPITPAFPAADYAPAASTQPRRQTGTIVSTVAISSPPSRHLHNRRSRRRSRRHRSLHARRRHIAPSSDEAQRGEAKGRDGWTEKGLDERKGSDEAADIKEGVPPATENRKRGYNRYAALSSTEEDADFESQEYGSAGYGVGIIGVGGDNLYEGLGRIIMLEQDSGINYSPGDAPADFSTKMQQERKYADPDTTGYDGWKEKLPPRLSDFTFSFPSTLTETNTTTRRIATTRTRTTAAAASLLDPPITSHNNRCIVGDGNKAVVLSPPSASASFTSHSPLVLFCGEESAEQKLFSSSRAGEEDISLRYMLNRANSLSQTSSRAMLSSRPAVPSPPAQVAPLRPSIPLSSKLIPKLIKGRIPVTPPRPFYNPLPLPKFVPPAAARKLAMQGRGIPVCLSASSIDTTAPPLLSIEDPARMEKTKEKRKREENESGYYGLSSSAAIGGNDGGVLKKKMMVSRWGSWLEQELPRMWKESGDDSSSSSSSTITTPTALIGSERRRPGMMKMSRDFSTMTGGGSEDNAKVVDAEWLEYIMIPPRIEFGQGQGAVGNGNVKFEVAVIASVVAPAGFDDEDKGARKVTGSDIFADEERKEIEEEGWLVKLFGEREIEIENIAGGREGGGLGDELELASEMEMGESWGWDAISRVEAYD